MSSLAPLPSCYVMLNDAHLTCSVSESACYFDNLIPSIDYSRREEIFIQFDSIMFCFCCLTKHNSTNFTSKVLFETIQEAKILLFRHCPFNQSKFLKLFNANIRLFKTEKANNSCTLANWYLKVP